MDISEWITPIIFLVSVLIMIYLVGISIVNLVDTKLGDIEIKLPQINVNTKLNVSKNAKGLINICEDKTQPENTQQSLEQFETTSNIVDKDFKMIDLNTHTNTKNNKTIQVNTNIATVNSDNTKKVGCNTDNDCNIVNGNGLNVCKSDGTCHCLSGSGSFCQYGPTNYKDPNSMTEQEKRIFKYQYRNNFTLQDYKN